FYEEFGWAVIFAANTGASAWLLANGPMETLLVLNVVFGAGYLPWQLLHLKSLWANARTPGMPTQWAEGLSRSLRVKNRRTDAGSWGGAIGLTWMTAYWVVLIPPWVAYVAWALARRPY